MRCSLSLAEVDEFEQCWQRWPIGVTLQGDCRRQLESLEVERLSLLSELVLVLAVIVLQLMTQCCTTHLHQPTNRRRWLTAAARAAAVFTTTFYFDSTGVRLPSTRVSFSSFWKWVILPPSSEKKWVTLPFNPLCQQKMGIACNDNKTGF